MKAALLSTALICLCSATVYSQTPTPTPQPSPAAFTSEKIAEKTKPAETAPAKTGKAALTLPAEKLNPVKAVMFAKPPVIDGKLDDEVWKTAIVLKDFYQIQPGDNLIPENRTEVMLGYDARFLYIAFHCYDDPAKVRANIPKRDQIWDDDYVGILFDTFNDQRRAYEFDF